MTNAVEVCVAATAVAIALVSAAAAWQAPASFYHDAGAAPVKVPNQLWRGAFLAAVITAVFALLLALAVRPNAEGASADMSTLTTSLRLLVAACGGSLVAVGAARICKQRATAGALLLLAVALADVGGHFVYLDIVAPQRLAWEGALARAELVGPREVREIPSAGVPSALPQETSRGGSSPSRASRAASSTAGSRSGWFLQVDRAAARGGVALARRLARIAPASSEAAAAQPFVASAADFADVGYYSLRNVVVDEIAAAAFRAPDGTVFCAAPLVPRLPREEVVAAGAAAAATSAPDGGSNAPLFYVTGRNCCSHRPATGGWTCGTAPASGQFAAVARQTLSGAATGSSSSSVWEGDYWLSAVLAVLEPNADRDAYLAAVRASAGRLGISQSVTEEVVLLEAGDVAAVEGETILPATGRPLTAAVLATASGGLITGGFALLCVLALAASLRSEKASDIARAGAAPSFLLDVVWSDEDARQDDDEMRNLAGDVGRLGRHADGATSKTTSNADEFWRSVGPGSASGGNTDAADVVGPFEPSAASLPRVLSDNSSIGEGLPLSAKPDPLAHADSSGRKLDM